MKSISTTKITQRADGIVTEISHKHENMDFSKNRLISVLGYAGVLFNLVSAVFNLASSYPELVHVLHKVLS